MIFAQRLSELLDQPRVRRQGFPWAILRLIAPSLTTLAIVLAVAIIGQKSRPKANPSTNRLRTKVSDHGIGVGGPIYLQPLERGVAKRYA